MFPNWVHDGPWSKVNVIQRATPDLSLCWRLALTTPLQKNRARLMAFGGAKES